jgi:hypothetical protein
VVLIRRRRPCSSGCRKASCNVLNKPRDPGIASVIERSSPRRRCHVLVEMRRREGGTESRISWSRRRRWGGSVNVFSLVSIIQPKTVFLVDHAPSPCRSFLTEAGSWRWPPSVLSSGRKTWSSVWRSTRCWFRRAEGGPCTSWMKSST